MTSPIRNSAPRPHALQAFTLIELSVVVFILAVMTAVVTPYFVNSYRAAQFESVVREFVTTTRFARMQAALHQQPVQVRVDLDNQMFWVVAALTNGVETTAESPAEESAVLRISHVPRAARINAVLKPDEPETFRGIADINFYPNGTCDSVTVVFLGAEKKDVLVVSIEPLTAHATITTPKL